MITLCNGAMPRRVAVGVFQVIQYLRELGGFDDNFTDLPDEIVVPAVRISMPDLSFSQEMYGSPESGQYKLRLKILDRNERSPKVLLSYGDLESPGLMSGQTRMSFVANPFRDIKRIEEYEMSLIEDPDVKYLLIKLNFEKMSVTFLKWA